MIPPGPLGGLSRAMTPVAVVFVPGLMGSALTFVGEGPRKDLCTIPVWDEDLGIILDVLSSNPDRLAGELRVGRILRRISAYGVTMTTLYGPLLDALERIVAKQPRTSLTLFPYDWRKDIRVTARELDEVVRRLPTDTELCFIGHSLGCLVIRMLLLSQEDLQARTRRLIQLAPPALGSSTSYYSLRHSPELNFVGSLAEWLRGIRSFVSSRPNLEVRLRERLAGFDSLYCLMPPKAQLILANSSGEFFSALDRRGWPELYHPKLIAAEELHSLLSVFEFKRTVTYYGTDISTERDYVIDDQFTIVAKLRAWISGDGTVTQASAVYNSPIELRRPVPNVAHHHLPACQPVLDALEALIAGAVFA